LLLSVSSVHLLGGLYGDVPSDVINVYQPPGTDICITFKSPLMRGRFTNVGVLSWFCKLVLFDTVISGQNVTIP